jgi:hypothetical protein
VLLNFFHDKHGIDSAFSFVMRALFVFGVIAQSLCCASSSAANPPASPIREVWGGGRHTIALLNDGSV